MAERPSDGIKGAGDRMGSEKHVQICWRYGCFPPISVWKAVVYPLYRAFEWYVSSRGGGGVLFEKGEPQTVSLFLPSSFWLQLGTPPTHKLPVLPHRCALACGKAPAQLLSLLVHAAWVSSLKASSWRRLDFTTNSHRCPFWWFWQRNRWVSIPGLPGGLLIYQGNPSISPKKDT